MKIKTGILLLMLVLLTNHSFSQQNNHFPPEVTAEELELSFWDIPYLNEAYIAANPMVRNDGIAVGELDLDENTKDKIVKLAQEIADSTYGKYDSFLIAQKGRLLFESYFNRGRINLPHFQASATKSYTSLAIGRAIKLGYLTMADLDKPLVSFLKDLDETKFVEGVEKITLHQALTMRSGLRFTDEEMSDFRNNSEKFKGLDQIQAFLELSDVISTDSQTYKYRGNDPIMVMQVLDAVVPGSAKDFIKNELFDKLGIQNYSWRNDLSGLPTADSSASITARDMLKLGTLVKNKGQWNGEQLLSKAYLEKALSAITRSNEDWQPENFFYGYLWYQTQLTYKDKNYDTNIAWGAGGNRIITIEELELIIVITGHDLEDATIMDQISKTIIPAFVKNDSMPTENQYLGQKPPGRSPELFAPDIIHTEYREAAAAFSPDLKEFYFRRRGGDYEKNTLFMIQQIDNQWVETEVPPYAGEPFVSLDGKTLYIGNKYRERSDAGWGEVTSHNSIFKDIYMMRLTVSSKGTYFFDEGTRDGLGKIHYSRKINGNFEKPIALPETINAGMWNAHPFIAPDETYIIWDGERETGFGDNDLYISFKQEDGTWGNAINLGEKINTEHAEAYGSISPDGKYFFFHRSYGGDTGDIFWVDAQVVFDLREK